MQFWSSSAFMLTTELVPIARMLDEAGYHGIMLSDHICYPKELASPYPYSPYEDGRPIWDPETAWPDTWVMIGAMAAATERLHMSNNIFVAPNRPLLAVAMVLLAATVSLRSFRAGGIQTMVVAGMIGGFGFFLLAEVSRQLGLAGLTPVWAAVWLPVLLTIFLSLTVLMHQEDG